MRPQTESGRPLSGVVRPTTQATQGGSIEKALRTARTAQTARPVSAASGRHVRLVTASMVSEPDGPFINIARINMDNYAKKPALARHLFEYIFHEASDVKRALELASAATQVASFSDWWWKFQLGRCYERLGLIRDAEQQFRSSIKTSPMIREPFFSADSLASLVASIFFLSYHNLDLFFIQIDLWTYLHLGRLYVRLDQPLVAIDVHEQGLKTFPGEVKLMLAIARVGHNGRRNDQHIRTYLHLGRVYVRLDQPLVAIDVYEQGLKTFPGEVKLMLAIARIHEALGQQVNAVKMYRSVVASDAMNIEAIACIGLNHFYSDQPELALRFYRYPSLPCLTNFCKNQRPANGVFFSHAFSFRRLLQMGLHSPEVFANIGLCCFYAQQYDLTLSCFERALGLAEDPTIAADIWYNLGHIGIGLGDSGLAHQCFCLALAHNAGHGEACNNLGILELRKGNEETAKAFFQTAATISSHLFEPFYNFASLAEKVLGL
ncbi:unnamed protein product, partial [Darwinula stevensoni]